MDRYFIYSYNYFSKRKWLFWLCCGLVFIALGLTAGRIHFEEDISRLIPNSEKNSDLQRVLETVNFSDKIVVLIEKEAGGDTEDLIAAADAFSDSLLPRADRYVKEFQGRVEDETALRIMDLAYENMPLFLSDSDYEILESRVDADSIRKIVEENYTTLVSPAGIVSKQTIIRDPLGISLLGLKHLQQTAVIENFELNDGYLVGKEGTYLLLFITTRFATSETAENQEFALQLEDIRKQLNIQFRDMASINYYGGALIAVANAKQIKRDITFTVSIVVVILLVLFILFYRKLSIPLILGMPTLFGALMAVTVLSFARTEISAISLGIGSVLLGVTLDYGLHILTHLRNGSSVTQLYSEVTAPILMSALTTALAFLCLLFIDSRALNDLGLFAACSVLGAAVFALFFIPHVYRGSGEKLKSNVLDKIAKVPYQKSNTLLGVIVLASVIGIFTFRSVEFNGDLGEFNFVPPSLQQTEKRLDTLTNITERSLYITAFGEDIEAVLQQNELVYERLKVHEDYGHIEGFSSAATLFASEKKQELRINTWNAFWTDSLKAAVQNVLVESGRTVGFKEGAHSEFYELLQKEFQPLSIEEYRDFPKVAANDFLASESGFHTVTSVVRVKPEFIPNIKASFENSEQVVVIDRQGLNESLLGSLKDDFNSLMLYCLLAVSILLLLYYRSLKLLLVTLLPIILTWLITLGAMGILGLQFNVFNVIITAFIFGLGVDYSIFITNGLIRKASGDLKALPTHKTSVLLSVITTLLGVGVLIFARHPALNSIAAVSLIGILTAVILAFVLQPVLYQFINFKLPAKE